MPPGLMMDKPFDVFAPRAGDSRWLPHLLRRTCFGVTVTRAEQLAGKTPAEVVDWLLTYDAADDPLNHLLDDLEGFLSPFAKVDQLQGWWVYRMFHTPRPFQERLALFWHNRFATSVGKIDNIMFMHKQIELFRKAGLGNYRSLVLAVGRDPAMLLWLDGAQSKKGKPNENYGRELMELFTLGIGNYTERDIKEVARAFTGWSIKNGEGTLDPKMWDAGEKEVFGVKFPFDDEQIVDLILLHPAAARYLAKKLLQEFVLPTPTEEMIAHYAARLTANKWELKPTIREMFTSNLFFSDAVYRSKIKSPTELVIGSILMMMDSGGKPSVDATVKSITAMGQALLMPPSVKGWDGEQAWINANTMLARMNFALGIATQKGKDFVRKGDLTGYLQKRELATAEKIVDHFAKVLLDGNIEQESRAKLLTFMTTDDKGKAREFVLTADTVGTRVRPMLHLMMTMPEYQLA